MSRGGDARDLARSRADQLPDRRCGTLLHVDTDTHPWTCHVVTWGGTHVLLVPWDELTVLTPRPTRTPRVSP